MPAKPIPVGYHSVTPYLILDGAAKAIDFYKQAFSATELMRMKRPDGRIAHAEIFIGNSAVMMADEAPEMGSRSPKALGGSSVHLLIYVLDVDKVFARALAAGGKQVKPLANQFYGDRSGTLSDPFGHQWTVATHIEDVTPEEMKRREAALYKGAPAS